MQRYGSGLKCEARRLKASLYLVSMPQQVHVKRWHDEVSRILLVQVQELSVVVICSAQELLATVMWQAHLQVYPLIWTVNTIAETSKKECSRIAFQPTCSLEQSTCKDT